MPRTLEISKNEHGNIEVSIRSEAERDVSAVIEDPAAHILTVATLAGIQVTMTGSPAETMKVASGEVAEGAKPE